MKTYIAKDGERLDSVFSSSYGLDPITASKPFALFLSANSELLHKTSLEAGEKVYFPEMPKNTESPVGNPLLNA